MTDVHESSLKPAQFLVENVEILPKGRALDVAMGSGRNAIYLSKMGFEVEGIDISPKAVCRALELARTSGVNLRAQVATWRATIILRKGHITLLSVSITCNALLSRRLKMPCAPEAW